MIINHKEKFIYYDIPKTGSTTLDHYFKGIAGSEVVKNKNKFKYARVYSPKYDDYRLFASVRDPYCRAYSMFIDYRKKNIFNGPNFKEFMKQAIEISEHNPDSNLREHYMWFSQLHYLSFLPSYRNVEILYIETIRESLKELNLPKSDSNILYLNSNTYSMPSLGELGIMLVNHWAERDFKYLYYQQFFEVES